MTTETRSVIASGHSLSVSIPASWCYQNNVVKGSKLNIDIQEHSLYIRLKENPIQDENIIEQITEETGIDQQQLEGEEQEPTAKGFSVTDRIKKALENERGY